MYFSALTTSASAASLPTRSAPFFFAILTTAAIGKSAMFLTSKKQLIGGYIYFLGKMPNLPFNTISERMLQSKRESESRISQNIFYSL
jgi:hypothetical protein